MYTCVCIYIYIYSPIFHWLCSRRSVSAWRASVFATRDNAEVRITILYITTTTQRGWCLEVFVSSIKHFQSQTSVPGGGGVQNLSPQEAAAITTSVFHRQNSQA